MVKSTRFIIFTNIARCNKSPQIFLTIYFLYYFLQQVVESETTGKPEDDCTTPTGVKDEDKDKGWSWFRRKEKKEESSSAKGVYLDDLIRYHWRVLLSHILLGGRPQKVTPPSRLIF